MKGSNQMGMAAKVTAAVLVAVVVTAANGCFSKKNKSAEEPATAFTIKSTGGTTDVASRPAPIAVGRVASVNAQAKFAVISFPIGQLPGNDTRLSIFRAGAKTGELRVTGPAQDTFTVGDIISGTAQEGDEVRPE